MTADVVAAIDLGSNSTRWLLADETGTAVLEELRTTRLGAGASGNGDLDAESVARTVHALAECRMVLDRYRVTAVRAVATSAVRDAGNKTLLLDAAEAVLGVRPEVISGEHEGRLAFAGAVGDRVAGSVLVVDIGGGSTELVVGRGGPLPEVVASASTNVGCVRLARQFFAKDRFSGADVEAARSLIELTLDRVPDVVWRLPSATTVVGVAGTVTTLAQTHLELVEWDPRRVHGYVIQYDTIAKMTAQLSAMTSQERRAAVIPSERADVVVAGALVLLAVLRRTGLAAVEVSTMDLLHGIVGDILGARNSSGPEQESPPMPTEIDAQNLRSF